MTAPLLAVSLLLLVLGAFTAWYVHSIQQQSADLNSKSIATSNASQTLENHLRELRTNLNEFVITADREYLQAAKINAETVDVTLRKAEELDEFDENQPTLIAIRNKYASFNEQFIQSLESPAVDDQQIFQQIVQTFITKDLIPLAKQHRETQQAKLENMSRQSQAIADRVSLTLLLLVTCGAIGGMMAGIAVARSINRSIVELNIPVHAAKGSLSEVVGPIKISSNGNLAGIRESLDEMVSHVGETVQRLQDSQNRILRTEQMNAIGQLAAGMAHEIRNPLTSMRSIVQSANQHGGASALDDRDVEILEIELERLNELVQTFLDFARPPRIARRLVDLNGVIQRTVQLTKSRAELVGISVTVDLPTSDMTISADPHQLQQVMLNLVLNAIEAQPDGGSIEIQLRSNLNAAKNALMEIKVRDFGGGIPPEVFSRIFEPFFSTKETGTGIGLAICLRIVQDHGGTITQENATTGGSVFTIVIPVE